jgi:hypothetical protein
MIIRPITLLLNFRIFPYHIDQELCLFDRRNLDKMERHCHPLDDPIVKFWTKWSKTIIYQNFPSQTNLASGKVSPSVKRQWPQQLNMLNEMAYDHGKPYFSGQ